MFSKSFWFIFQLNHIFMKELNAYSKPAYGFSNTPFGECLIAFSDDGICALTFPEDRESGLLELERRFQNIKFTYDNYKAEKYVRQIFELKEMPELYLIGTPFQISIWEALQQIPKGKTSTYAKIAEIIGRPKAVRAVGSAIGANPIAFLIPCHRVLRTDGGLGGFRWGLEIKKKMLDWEIK